MNIYKIKHPILLFCILSIFAISCGNLESTYSEFLESGEKIYPGKIDTIVVHSGYKRIKLSLLLNSDPTITRSVVFWNNKRDSVEVPINRSQNIDTVNVIISDLEEGIYTFEALNYDSEGNKSILIEIIGEVYGDVYRSTLLDRIVKNVSYDGKDLLLEWDASDETAIGQQITFFDNAGNIKEVYSPVREDSTMLNGINIHRGFSYTTIYMPDSLSIDTFETDPFDISLGIDEIEFEVDRSGFSMKDLPGDENEANSTNNSFDRLWTNDYNINATPFISKAWQLNDCSNLVPFPYWFTIDMGEIRNLASITIYQRGGAHLFTNNNLKEFEVWGALEIDDDYNPKNHGGVFDENWILLEECEIIRPADESSWTSEANKGHEFDLRIDGKVQNIRYLRIKILDNWLPETGSCEVKKRTYVNIAAIRLEEIQEAVYIK